MDYFKGEPFAIKKKGGTNQGRGRRGGGKGRDKVKQNMICMYENAE